MHHKRKRPRNRRAGCKMCKYWKVNGANTSCQLKPSENRQMQEAIDKMAQEETRTEIEREVEAA